MNEIEIKSKWLSFALGARNNRLSLEELYNTKVLDFNLQEYITGNNDVYNSDITKELPEEEIIKQTTLFMEELSLLKAYDEFDLEHISLCGLNFKDTSLDIVYDMPNLKAVILQENKNCRIQINKLKNIKSMNLIIDKECETKSIDISDYTKYSMGLPIVCTEFDLYMATKRINFSDNNIDIVDVDTISQYTYDMATISIKSIDDIKKIRKMNLDNVLIGIRTSEIRDMVELSQIVDYVKDFITRSDKNIDFNQVIDNVADMTVEQLNIIENKISDNKKFSKIKMLKYIDCYEEYSVDKYKKIRGRIDELISDIDLNLPDVEKFLAVENKIIYNICFDKLAETDEVNKEYFNQNYISSRNLEGGLLNGKCVCAGYADILRNMLKCVNIDATFVKGEWKGKGHAWNQVKLDYDWYNTDLTAGRYKTIQGQENEYCLKSDSFFYSNNGYSVNINDKANMYMKVCPKSYNMYKIKEYVSQHFTNCSPNMIISIIEEIQNIANEKYSITFIKTDNDQCQVMFTQKKDNELQIYPTQMCIDKDDIGKFVKTYFDRYEGQCKGVKCKDSPLTFVSCQEGIGLIMGTTMRNRLFEEGVIDLRTMEEREEYEQLKNVPVDMI